MQLLIIFINCIVYTCFYQLLKLVERFLFEVWGYRGLLVGFKL